MRYPPANREPEFELFNRMLAGETEERILLLEAGGGMGKTTLLEAFMRHCSQHTDCVPIDLKGSGTGLHEIFYKVCESLEWERFPAFRACMERRVGDPVQVNINKNWMFGRNEIKVALHSAEASDRAIQRAELTRAFLEDLRKMRRRLLLVFDTFDEASPDVQEWLEGSFLGAARRISDLFVVVAGRRVPKPTIEWSAHCCHRCLSGVEDVDAWDAYAQRCGLFVPRDWIEGYCVALEGHPAQVDGLLAQAAIRRGGR